MPDFTQGLLSNPMFNLGIGLLSSRGRPEGLLTGMNQLNRNITASQNAQYQQAIMEELKRKAEGQARQRQAQERLPNLLAQSPVTQEQIDATQGGLPTIGPQGPAVSLDQSQADMMRNLMQVYPGVAEEMLAQQFAPNPQTVPSKLKEFAAFSQMDKNTQEAMLRYLKAGTAQFGPGNITNVPILPDSDVTALGLNPNQKWYLNQKTGKPEAIKQDSMTQGEAKTIAQGEDALVQIDELNDLLFGKNPVDLSGLSGLAAEFRSGKGIWNAAVNAAIPLDDRQAEALGLMVGLENSLLAAIRGAQVGPAEQEMFARQLTVAGQPLNVQRANLDRTKRTVDYLNKRAAKLRSLNVPEDAPSEVANNALDSVGFDRSFEENFTKNTANPGKTLEERMKKYGF